MVILVDSMLSTQAAPDGLCTPPKTALQYQIESIDRQTDALVYKLYGQTWRGDQDRGGRNVFMKYVGLLAPKNEGFLSDQVFCF
jgi:hypothetical protein